MQSNQIKSSAKVARLTSKSDFWTNLTEEQFQDLLEFGKYTAFLVLVADPYVKRATIQDISRDIALKVYGTCVKSGTTPKNYRAYYATSVKRESIRVVKNLRKEIAGNVREFPSYSQSTSFELEDTWIHHSKMIKIAIKKLKERERIGILLFYFENKSYAEIAITLAVTKKAAESLVHRARVKLRDMLKPALRSTYFNDLYASNYRNATYCVGGSSSFSRFYRLDKGSLFSDLSLQRNNVKYFLNNNFEEIIRRGVKLALSTILVYSELAEPSEYARDIAHDAFVEIYTNYSSLDAYILPLGNPFINVIELYFSKIKFNIKNDDKITFQDKGTVDIAKLNDLWSESYSKLVEKLRIDSLEREFSELPKKQRLLLIYHIVLGLSFKEITILLNYPNERLASNHYLRIKKNLRESSEDFFVN